MNNDNLQQPQFEFRVWDKPNKMFLKEFQTDYGQWVWGRQKDLVGQSTFKWILDHPEDFTVCMWSLLYDKNKNKIFSGDIIELTVNEPFIVQCVFGITNRFLGIPFGEGSDKDYAWNECKIPGFYFLHTDGVKSFPIINNFQGKCDTDLFEVVGNIYEHPHLLIE